MSGSLRAVDIIAAKRDRKVLSKDEIFEFIRGYTKGTISDYQAAAWCMTVYLNGMNKEEVGFLVQAMIESGSTIKHETIKLPLVDKHSTGGVGDKISLILAPVAAACGVKIPMMSGRALGHTGGTLDKLDSIPGYSTELSKEKFKDGVRELGFAMTGQSEDIVPADRKLYALRDVIAAVESIPLITGSILSKKIAEGSNALIMDVKCGRGAFMKNKEDALALAKSLIDAGKELGCRVVALITDMSNPLGRTVGNFLEIEETVASLKGKGEQDVMELVYRQAAWMMILSGIETDINAAEIRCQQAITDGSAYEKFCENVKFQGGSLKEMNSMLGSARGECSREIRADKSGYIDNIDAYAVGMASVVLGVGRNTMSDSVDAFAGIEFHRKRGDSVNKEEPIMRLWAKDESRLDSAFNLLSSAIEIDSERKSAPKTLILEEMIDV